MMQKLAELDGKLAKCGDCEKKIVVLEKSLAEASAKLTDQDKKLTEASAVNAEQDKKLTDASTRLAEQEKKLADVNAEQDKKLAALEADLKKVDGAARGASSAPRGDTRAELTRQGEEIIWNHTAYVAAVSILPFAGVDLVAVTALQLRMLSQLTALYGHERQWSDDLGRKLIGIVLADATGVAVAGRLVKFFPPFSLAAAVVGPATAGAATTLLGRIFHTHYASGGDLRSFDAAKARRQYQLAAKDGV
jgi:uncharacterized protein (DUF697 family)